ncbi:MAG: hypothetical protein ACREUY_04820 [Burkholderiales bacterium]
MTATISGYRCPTCKHSWRLRNHNFPFTCACGRKAATPSELERYSETGNSIKRNKLPPAPKEGVGTELTALLAMLGSKAVSSCQCKARAKALNRRGIEWCKANREKIVAWLQEAYDNLAFTEIFQAATIAAFSGLALDINPLDICGSLVDIAIARATASLASGS